MHIHELDFHYHAGQERPADQSLFLFLEHARMTGRRVLEHRFRASNLPQTLQLMWSAYQQLQAAGATFVPGSDQHGFMRGLTGNRMGGWVPFETFERLGIRGEDIRYIDHFLGANASGERSAQ